MELPSWFTYGSRPASIPHHRSPMRIEASMRFLGYHSSQLGTKGLAGDLYEPHARVKGEVPGCRAQAPPPMRWVDVNLFEMRQVMREHLHQREANWRVPRRDHPQPPIAGGIRERALVRGLGQHGLRGVAAEQPGRRHLDRRECR